MMCPSTRRALEARFVRLTLMAAILLRGTSADARDQSEDQPLAPLPPPTVDDSPMKTESLPYRRPDLRARLPLLELVLQSGYALPVGKTASTGPSMSRAFGSEVPIDLEIGARMTANLFLGIYVSYALGSATDCVTPGTSCLLTTTRFGFISRVRFSPDKPMMPWIGYGFGYESTSTEILTSSGLEFAHLGMGVDWRALRDGTFGPVLDFSIGQYERETGTSPSADGSVPRRALHGWISLGLRGSWML